MKFSFIIPTFNEERYILKCINSIKKQAGSDFEIIVVDNGSTDKTIKSVKENDVILVEEENKGISNARNLGASKAKGTYLCFIDADGVLKNDWLTEVREVLGKEDVTAIAGLNVFTHKNLFKRFYYNIYTFFAYSSLILLKIISGKLFLPGNNLVIKRDVFSRLGGFDPYIGEDLFLSKKFWKLKNVKSFFNQKMIIYYSSRGFDEVGFLKTILFWIISSIFKVSGKNYSYKTKNNFNLTKN